ncbi:MAG: hypothetical protein QG582_193 [Candidatus Thermoplasmatota archaeon]|nr:hypothetical protein [Candidatus Thermoplasmatota archaeon]
MTSSRTGWATHIHNVQTAGMAAQANAKALSTARARDIDAATSSEGVRRRIRNEALLTLTLVLVALVGLWFILMLV